MLGELIGQSALSRTSRTLRDLIDVSHNSPRRALVRRRLKVRCFHHKPITDDDEPLARKKTTTDAGCATPAAPFRPGDDEARRFDGNGDEPKASFETTTYGRTLNDG